MSTNELLPVKNKQCTSNALFWTGAIITRSYELFAILSVSAFVIGVLSKLIALISQFRYGKIYCVQEDNRVTTKLSRN